MQQKDKEGASINPDLTSWRIPGARGVQAADSSAFSVIARDLMAQVLPPGEIHLRRAINGKLS